MPKNNLKARLDFSVKACRIAGQALIQMRASRFLQHYSKVGQVKALADLAAEKAMLCLLEKFYPKDIVLSEERWDSGKKFVPQKDFWLLDALDGTASFVHGYNGFCVQLAFISSARPLLGVVFAPALDCLYWAVSDQGAFLKIKNRPVKKLSLKSKSPAVLTYIDNRPAKGPASKLMKSIGAMKFLEMGSYGLKVCQVAQGRADIFFKPGEFKVWDTAPGGLILSEAGGKLSLWNGQDIDYSGKNVKYNGLLAAEKSRHQKLVEYLNYDKRLLSNLRK